MKKICRFEARTLIEKFSNPICYDMKYRKGILITKERAVKKIISDYSGNNFYKDECGNIHILTTHEHEIFYKN